MKKKRRTFVLVEKKHCIQGEIVNINTPVKIKVKKRESKFIVLCYFFIEIIGVDQFSLVMCPVIIFYY